MARWQTKLKGDKTFVPFRQLGQYEDSETPDLYYNRFRFYDCETGLYLSQDPIGLAGNNPTMYGYVFDSNGEFDPFGLTYVSGPISPSVLSGKDKVKNSTQQLSEWRRSVKSSELKDLRNKFLGEDHVKVDKGKWRSLDGKRQFRATPSDYLGKHGMGNPVVANQRHVHLEFLRDTGSGNFVVEKNVHLPINNNPKTKTKIKCKT